MTIQRVQVRYINPNGGRSRKAYTFDWAKGTADPLSVGDRVAVYSARGSELGDNGLVEAEVDKLGSERGGPVQFIDSRWKSEDSLIAEDLSKLVHRMETHAEDHELEAHLRAISDYLKDSGY